MLQEINASHHQRKRLIKAIQNERVLFVEDNGDVVINIKGYREYCEETGHDPLRVILGIEELAQDLEYLVVQ